MKTRKRPGQTLIEVTIAALISAITTTAIFSVILSSFVADARTDKRDAAAMVLKRAQDTLKSYVSSVPTDANMFPGVVPPEPAKPGAPGSTVGHWSAEGGAAWALAGSAGGTVHNVDSLVAGPPLTMPGGPLATLRYTVFNTNCLALVAPLNIDANQCKRVVFNLAYTD
ncbi:MAG: hypothetical protein Q7R35_13895 [Elusimicrobiota bacterium]|nr:hypothetical protein [Elusimicrobiota bacterium]